MRKQLLRRSLNVLFLAVLFSGCSLSSLAEPFDPGNDITLQLFRDISRIYRVGDADINAIQFLESLVKENQPYWNGRLTTKKDKFGNLAIRIPATGKFALDSKAPAIAIQFHVDMVGASIALDNNHESYLKNGIDLVQSGDMIHAKDHRTNIGADNGIGMAMGARYLLDREAEHPELWLVATRLEELGLLGAFDWDIDLPAQYMINVDWDKGNQICIGCQGGKQVRATAKVVTEEVPSSFVSIEFSVTGLIGGHSGVDIHRDRVHAVNATLEFLSTAFSSFDLRLMRVEAGDPTALNAIPRQLSFELAVSPDQLEPLKTAWEDFLERSFANTDDEKILKELKPPSVKTQVSENARGVGRATMTSILSQVASIPRGVIVPRKGNLPRFTTSSIGFFSLSPQGGKRSQFDFRTGYFVRSYDAEDIQRLDAESQQSLRLCRELKGLRLTESQLYPPQLNLYPDDFLKYLRTRTNTTLTHAPGAQETSVFANLFPEMKIISIGPKILNAHSPSEAMSRSSVQQSVGLLDTLLCEIPAYHQQCRNQLAESAATRKAYHLKD